MNAFDERGLKLNQFYGWEIRVFRENELEYGTIEKKSTQLIRENKYLISITIY